MKFYNVEAEIEFSEDSYNCDIITTINILILTAPPPALKS